MKSKIILLILSLGFVMALRGQTSFVANVNAGSSGNPISDIIAFNGALYFGANNGSAVGTELYKYDGSTVTLAADIEPTGSSYPEFFCEYNGELYFNAITAPFTSDLVKYDGTSVSTVSNTSNIRNPSYLCEYNNKLYFAAYPAGSFNNKSALYVYDGTAVTMITAFDTTSFSSPIDLTVYNGALYFSALHTSIEGGLYKYDGNTISLVHAYNPTDPLLDGHFLCVHNGELYFTDWPNPAIGEELYKYDGNTVSLAADINPTGSSYPFGTISYEGKLYFGADDGSGIGAELYSFDGNNASLVQDINPVGGSYSFTFGIYNNQLYFNLDTDGSGNFANIYKLDIPNSIDDIKGRNLGVVYANGRIDIQNYHAETGKIFNALGEEVMRINHKETHVSHLPSGVYFVNIFDFSGQMIYTQKFYVE